MSDTTTISRDQLKALIAEHEAAKAFCNIYFNPAIPAEEKYDAAAKLSHAVVLVSRTVVG